MTHRTPRTVPAVLAANAAARPDADAVTAPGGRTRTHARFAADVRAVAEALAGLGVTRTDRVLVTAPNTPEALTALFGAMSAAVAVPVDPAASTEFAALLDRLDPALVITVGDGGFPGDRAVSLTALLQGPAGDPGEPAPEDLAVLVPTSGSVSAPRFVALGHDQWLDGARRVVEHFGVGPDDRVLNLMPLHHNHGLNGTSCTALLAGGCVMLPGPTDLTALPGWLTEQRPTWATGAPAVHAALLDALTDRPGLVAELPLRFVRSASAPLPESLLAGLESTLGVPVVEIWGLTEACGQVTVNPVRAGGRGIGAVGKAAHGFRVAVLDEDGQPCATGQRGEVVVCGGLVSGGYWGDPEATAEKFTEAGLRTHDLGVLAEDGALTVLGRMSDYVNRGGDKLWLPEIDAACLAHPGIRAAMAFPVPHPRLGQDVAAAIVPEPGVGLEAAEVRNFLRGRLPARMIPRRIETLPALPLGPTGKPRRRLLAEHFASTPVEPAAARPATVRSPVSLVLLALWSDVLGRPELDEHDDFLAAGGDSILATKLAAAVSDVLGVEITIDVVLGAGSTVASMTEIVLQRRAALR